MSQRYRMEKSRRASTPNGGMGGGYELTDPDYDAKKLARMRREYRELEPKWRQTYLNGLTEYERKLVVADEPRS